jgi:phage gpG-like protein
MKQNQAKILERQLSLYLNKKPIILKKLGIVAKKYFLDSFRMKGWDGNKWQPRKDGSNRNLLVKTGKLKNSLVLSNATRNSITVSTNVDYASFHNDGTSKLSKREFMGPSRELDIISLVIINDEIKKIFK